MQLRGRSSKLVMRCFTFRSLSILKFSFFSRLFLQGGGFFFFYFFRSLSLSFSSSFSSFSLWTLSHKLIGKKDQNTVDSRCFGIFAVWKFKMKSLCSETTLHGLLLIGVVEEMHGRVNGAARISVVPQFMLHHAFFPSSLFTLHFYQIQF